MTRQISRYLERENAKPERERNYGYWLPPEGVKHKFRVGKVAVPHVMQADEKKDTCLWPYLFKAFPEWVWGVQGIGDCVSWEWAHKIDELMAIMVHLKNEPQKIVAQCASEAVYGFGRVEIFGRPDYGGDGMYGGAAAEAVVKYGTLHRLNYEEQNVDLRYYSGSRAAEWGKTGVPDKLEPIAVKTKPTDIIAVTDSEMAGALIQQGYPVGYCGYTYWGTSRNSDGIARRFGSGWHGMCITGVRYRNDEPYAFWVANTGHGDHCSGPVGPYEVPDVYAECGSWVPASRCENVFKDGDCFAHSFYEGFPLQDLSDWGQIDIFGS